MYEHANLITLHMRGTYWYLGLGSQGAEGRFSRRASKSSGSIQCSPRSLSRLWRRDSFVNYYPGCCFSALPRRRLGTRTMSKEEGLLDRTSVLVPLDALNAEK
jgi:hypothetical protein